MKKALEDASADSAQIQAEATAVADFMRTQGDFYDNPLWTLNAFAFSGEGETDPVKARTLLAYELAPGALVLPDPPPGPLPGDPPAPTQSSRPGRGCPDRPRCCPRRRERAVHRHLLRTRAPRARGCRVRARAVSRKRRGDRHQGRAREGGARATSLIPDTFR